MTQQYCLASRLPGFPPQAFPTTISSLTSPQSISAVNSSPRPGIAPQSLHSSSQLLQLLGDLHPSLGYIWLRHGVSDSHSVLGYHRSAASLSALNVSPLTQKIALMQRLDPASVHPPARLCGVQSF